MTGKLEEIFEVKVTRNANTGIVKAEHWLMNGEGQSLSDDRPSTILYDDQGRPEFKMWSKHGKTHRVNAPAWIKINPENGIHVLEQFFEEGRCHRSGRLPAQIHRDTNTGEITNVRYFEHGVEKHWKKKSPIASSP